MRQALEHGPEPARELASPPPAPRPAAWPGGSSRYGLWFGVLSALLLLSCNGLFGQETPPPPRPGTEEPKAVPKEVRVSDAPPAPVYYVRDAASGKLVPLLGFGLQDFDRMLARDDQLQPPPARPAVLVDKLDLQGKVDGTRIEWTATVEASTSGTGWRRIPLRLKEAVFLEGKSVDAGREVLFEATEDGYAAWVRGDAGERHRLSLKLLSRFDQADAENRLRLGLPRAPASRLTLTVPGGPIAARAARPAILEAIRPLANAGNELIVSGSEGEIDLTWWSTDRRSAAVVGVAEATAYVAARIEGPSVRFDATLSVRTLQGKIQTLRIRLPEKSTLAGAVLVRVPGGDFVSIVPTTISESDPQIEIRLEEPSSGPIDCRLAALRLPKDERSSEPVHFSGFELVGAARHVGYYAIALNNDWQVLWEQRRGVGQIEPAELPEPLRGQPAQLAFETYSARSSLVGRIVRRQPQVSVEPHYRFEVHADRIEPSAHWKYLVRRAGVSHFEIDLPPGWTIDIASLSTKPPGLIDLDGLFETSTRPLLIPLKDRLIGEFELSLRARPAPLGSGPLELTFPAPLVNSLAPAVIEIQPADNILLLPRPEKMVGMQPLPGPPPPAVGGTRWEQEPLRYRTPVSTAKWVGDVKVLSRSVRIRTDTILDVTAGHAEVEQRFRYEVRHEPVKELALQLPGRLLAHGPWDVRLDGEPVSWNLLMARSDPTAELSLIRLPLSKERSGDFELRLKYRWPISAEPFARDATTFIPLVMPDEGDLRSNELQVRTEAGLTAIPLSADWRVLPDGMQAAGLGPDRWTAVSEARPSRIGLRVRREDPGEPYRLRRAWLQTWLEPRRRLDRLCLRLSGRSEALRVRLPEGVERESVQVRFGEFPGSAVLDLRTGDWLLRRPAAVAERHELDIELTYRLPLPVDDESAWARRAGIAWGPTLQPPTVEAPLGPEPWFWEIVTSADWKLTARTGDYVAESRWTRRGLGWEQEPLWSTAQLEAWIGVPTRTPLIEGTRRHLFSTWNQPRPLGLTFMGRSWLVLTVSAAALGLGLIPLFFAPLRRREFFALLAAGFALYGWSRPDEGLILLQAGALGGLLVALATVLRMAYSHPRRGALPTVRRGDAEPARWASTLDRRSPEAGREGAGSTATASLSVVGDRPLRERRP